MRGDRPVPRPWRFWLFNDGLVPGEHATALRCKR
jgi:hypothetical protein